MSLIFSAFTLGRGLVAGASALGIGALCFYGLGLSNEPGTMERSVYVNNFCGTFSTLLKTLTLADDIHTTTSL